MKIVSRMSRFVVERFPPAPSALTAALIAGACDLAAQRAAGAPAAVDGLSVGLALGVLAALFVLRVQDEHKDLEHDRVAHPERPLVRGLVDGRELALAAALAIGGSLLALALLSPRAASSFALVFGYAGLMWRDFFLGARLRARPLALLVSHQLVIPLLAAAVFLARGGPVDLVSLALTSTAALGCAWAFELGRKNGPGLVGALGPLVGGAAAVALCLRLDLGRVAPALIGALSLVAALPFLGVSPGRARARLGAGAGLSLIIYGGLIAAAFTGGAP